MPSRGLFKMSDNENILTCEVMYKEHSWGGGGGGGGVGGGW